MSKTDGIRQEILKSLTEHQTESFLTGVIRACGSVNLRKNGVELVVETEKQDVSDAVAPMFAALGASSIRRSVKDDGAKQKYSLTLSREDSAKLLQRLGILKEGYLPEAGIDFDRIYSEEEKIAFLKGLFAEAGSVSFSDGETGKGYHLEISLSDETLADDAIRLLGDLGLDKWHKISRKYNVGIYLKDREKIFDFLVLTGATKNALELQSAIAVKELRNTLNRQTNVQTANLDKTVNASAETIRDILFLKENGKLSELSEPVRKTAELRLEHPESPMAELAALAGITKSGLTHRLEKIRKFARETREKNNSGRNV